MPYIEQARRDAIDAGAKPDSVGELNYLITREVDAFLRTSPVSYGTLNAVVGVLECAKLELARRVVGPYEDEKNRANGDVYGVRRYHMGCANGHAWSTTAPENSVCPHCGRTGLVYS